MSGSIPAETGFFRFKTTFQSTMTRKMKLPLYKVPGYLREEYKKISAFARNTLIL